MPATVIGSVEWNTKGIILSRQSAQEQVNGLVNVQAEYSIPASKQYQIDRMFYVDAPPPIWPTVVNRAEMLTNNLYMTQRSISRANGLVIVNAEYASGLKRAGFRGYFVRETVETGKKATAYNYITIAQGGTPGVVTVIRTPAPNSVLRNTDIGSLFIYDERIKTVEFVAIGGQSSATAPTFTREALASTLGSVGGFGATTNTAGSADVWRTGGPIELYAAGLLSFEKDTPVIPLESAEFLTPSVQVVTLTYRLSR
jgi:hypothetical protein